MTLDDWINAQPGRCSGCGFHVTKQECACAGLAAAVTAMTATRNANPSAASAVEAAVRKLAATGQPFSANTARSLHGVRGGVVGSVFNALRQEGVIRAVGNETSTDRGTHGKSVGLWIGAAA